MDYSDQIIINSLPRTYHVHVPPTEFGPPSWLLLVFHGGGGRGGGMNWLTHFNSVADREQFMVAYPDGWKRHWTNSGESRFDEIKQPDDLQFLSQLIAKLVADHSIGSSKVYAAGISNGGFFAQRLALESFGKVKAIATVAATMPEPLSKVKAIDHPIPIMIIHGTNDPLVPFEGGHVKAGARGPILSARDSASKWTELNGCNANLEITDLPNIIEDSTHVRIERYGKCKDGAEVLLYVIEGGGHTWPGGSQYFPDRIIGKTTHNLDASEEIVDFFKRH
ncbi:MAG: alpha/beta hydrolase family esterase [Candidatus Bathyarchaeia archaeon]